MIILPFVPESPRYLVSNRADEVAGRAALAKLRGTADVGEELALMVAEDRQNRGPILHALSLSLENCLNYFLTVLIHFDSL